MQHMVKVGYKINQYEDVV